VVGRTRRSNGFLSRRREATFQFSITGKRVLRNLSRPPIRRSPRVICSTVWNAAVAANNLHTDRWNAGIALMKSTNPEGWTALVNEMNLVEPNHAVLNACREAAVRSKKPQPCTIVVPAE
jgi:hypothetical protein